MDIMRIMKIAALIPKSEFTPEQRHKLESLGQITYTDSRREYAVNDLIELIKDAVILAADPDNLGGFEKAKPRLTQLMESLPNLRGVALASTSYGWIDLEYCRKRNVPVANVPGYSREAVAEHALGLLLALAKRIIVSDRRTQKGKYEIGLGFELLGKTLGIVGLGSIGSRVAELGLGIGMRVVACNRSQKNMTGVEMKSYDELLKESDAISIHVYGKGNIGLIGKDAISKMKDGVTIVNTANREIVDERAMADAIKSGKVYGYAYEAEDLVIGPLAGIENAVGIQGFGWYTRESLFRQLEILIDNIRAISEGNPLHVVNGIKK